MIDNLAYKLAKKTYNALLRPHYGWRKLGIYNGIVARGPKLLDFTDVKPKNKSATHNGLETYAGPGDTVVVVGGGFGVSSIKAAQETAPDGQVIVYEGAREHIPLIEETAELNDVADRIEIRNNVVGEAHDIYGSWAERDMVSPEDLPECDVLLLDCEGAELSIIEDMAISPRVCLVECHPAYGATVWNVESLLIGHGYNIEYREEQHPYETTANTLLAATR